MGKSRTTQEADRALALTMEGITEAIGTPRNLKSSPEAVILALASNVGHLERVTLREAASTMDLVGNGYRMVPGFAPDPLFQGIIAPPEETEQINKNIIEQMAVRGDVPIGSHMWLSGIASVLGQISAMHGVPKKAISDIITMAWNKTPEEEVEKFQRMKQPAGDA
jgi:hypothetical protein